MEARDNIPVPTLPMEMWSAIHDLLESPEQIAFSKVSKAIHESLGGYLFVENQQEMDQALAFTGIDLKAIVIFPGTEKLMVPNKPASGIPIVCYGNDTVTHAGEIHVSGDIHITAYDNSQINLMDGARATAYGNAEIGATSGTTVEAHDNTRVYALTDAAVDLYDSAKLEAWSAVKVNAFDSCRVKAFDQVQITCHSSSVRVWASQDVTVDTDDSSVVKRLNENEISRLNFEELEAAWDTDQ